MKITKSWLLKREDQFWNELIFLLENTSPHFGKLGWAFNAQKDLVYLKQLPQQIPTTDENNETKICQVLMINLFAVAPNYNRTLLNYGHLLDENNRMIIPNYPRYRVRSAPPNYRPLKEGEIQEVDIAMFKKKLLLAGEKFLEKHEHFIKFRSQLFHWIDLITNRHLPTN